MGVYLQVVQNTTVEVDGIKFATSKFTGRLPTYYDMRIPRVERRHERLTAAAEKRAKIHAINGVKYVLGCNKGEFYRLLKEGYPVLFLTIGQLGWYADHDFDNHGGTITKVDGKLKINYNN